MPRSLYGLVLEGAGCKPLLWAEFAVPLRRPSPSVNVQISLPKEANRLGKLLWFIIINLVWNCFPKELFPALLCLDVVHLDSFSKGRKKLNL